VVLLLNLRQGAKWLIRATKPLGIVFPEFDEHCPPVVPSRWMSSVERD
jgi:hypothetical protein